MQKIRVKSFEENIKFDYPVCDVVKCERESNKLTMTETRFVDLCDYHYKEYVLGE